MIGFCVGSPCFCMDALETEQIRRNRISISEPRKKETFKLNWGSQWKSVSWKGKKEGGVSSIPKK